MTFIDIHLLLPSPSAVTTQLSLHQYHSHSLPNIAVLIPDPGVRGEGRGKRGEEESNEVFFLRWRDGHTTPFITQSPSPPYSITTSTIPIIPSSPHHPHHHPTIHIITLPSPSSPSPSPQHHFPQTDSPTSPCSL